MATILVTRPAAEAASTAKKLTTLGHAAILAPLLQVRATGAVIQDEKYDALVITSPRAIAVLAPHLIKPLSSLPIFAVGEQTAATARAASFANVLSAGADRHALRTLLMARLPAGAHLLLLAGRDRKREFESELAAAGYRTTIVETYVADAVPLGTDVIQRLKSKSVDAVVHYSPRSAALFARAVDESGADVTAVVHVCLSQDVAAALPDTMRANSVVAEAPNETALMDALDAALDGRRGHTVTGVPAGAAPADDASAETTGRRNPDGDGAIPGRNRQVPDDTRTNLKPKPTIELTAQDVTEPESDTARPETTPPATTTSAPAKPHTAKTAGGDVGWRHKLAPYVAVALAGAVVGAAGTIIPMLKPEAERPETVAARIEARMVGLEQKYGPLPAALAAAAPKDALAALEQRIAELQRRATPDPAIAAATGRIEQLEAVLRRLQSQPPAAPAALAEIVARIGRIETVVASRDPDAARDMAQVLAKRLDSIEAAIAATKSGPSREAIAELVARIAAVEARLQELGGRGERLSAAVADLIPRLDRTTQPLLQSLGALAKRVDAVESIAGAHSASLSAAVAVRRRALVDAMGAAFERGMPYQVPLDALGQLGTPASRMAALAIFAGKGAPGAGSLRAEFALLAGPIAATGTPPTTGSVTDRLSASLTNLVRVRPVDASGSDPQAIVARIETALGKGNFAEALKAWRDLSETARNAGKAFGDRLAARAAAAAELALLDAETLRGLSPAKP